MSQRIRGRSCNLVFPIGPKKKNPTNLVEDTEIFLLSFIQFNPVVSEEKSEMYQSIWGRAAILFFRWAQKHRLGR